MHFCFFFDGYLLGKCEGVTAGGSDDAAELGIDNVGGVFVVLGFGCLFALVVAALEFLWNVKKVAIDEKVSYLYFHL